MKAEDDDDSSDGAALGAFRVWGDASLVLTEEEANARAAADRRDRRWAFNATFLLDDTGLPWEAIDMLDMVQAARTEGATETSFALVRERLDELIDAASAADG